MSRIDRVLISPNVVNIFNDLKLVTLIKGWSDHLPLLVRSDKMDFGPIPFKCYHSWNSCEDFHEVVVNATDEAFGDPNNTLHDKMKIVKNHIKVWAKAKRDAGDQKKNVLMGRIHELEAQVEANNVGTDELQEILNERLNVVKELDKIEFVESIDLIQKARAKWDVKGDENSQYFHCLIKQRRKTQMINGININGNWITEPVVIKNAFFDFYKEKFSRPTYMFSNPGFTAANIITDNDRCALEDNVSEDEIRDAVWDCGINKSPGPDGFFFRFYKEILEHFKN
ncbi:uncharacterized protein [Rutidosis leptorrhynchoides]|uniref:uncharacterized protein n=1 Tax=Rutidosis leptorrhynchoides TaxID=125765 RepID=UPI003A98EBA6